MNIFEKDKSGALVDMNDSEFSKIFEVISKTQALCFELNSKWHSQERAKEIFEEIIGSKCEGNAWIMPPFYVDFGRNIKVGKNFLLQQNCTFMDRGGIEIGDDVFIGPKCNITTINHDFNPYNRQATFCKGVKIGSRVWIGINVTICPGVSIGDIRLLPQGVS